MIFWLGISEVSLRYEHAIARESPLFLRNTRYRSIKKYRSSRDEYFDPIGIVSVDTDSCEILHTELESTGYISLIQDEYALSIDSLKCPICYADIHTRSHRFDHDLVGADFEIRRKSDNIYREQYQHQSYHTHHISIILHQIFGHDFFLEKCRKCCEFTFLNREFARIARPLEPVIIARSTK